MYYRIFLHIKDWVCCVHALAPERLDEVRQRFVAALVVGHTDGELELEHNRSEHRVESFQVVSCERGGGATISPERVRMFAVRV